MHDQIDFDARLDLTAAVLERAGATCSGPRALGTPPSPRLAAELNREAALGGEPRICPADHSRPRRFISATSSFE